MKTYTRNRPGAARTRRIMLRILYVIAAAAVITFLSIMLGLHLQKKVAEAEKPDDPYAIRTVDDDGDTESDTVRDKSPAVFGVSLLLKDYKNTETVTMNVQKLAGYFDTLMIPVTDANGTLYFASDALQSLIMQPDAVLNPFTERMNEAVTSAKACGMRLCALYTPSRVFSDPDAAALVDGTLFSELASLGFDEIMLDCLTLCDADLSVADTSILRGYILSCTERLGGHGQIGLLLPAELYENTSAAKQVQMLATSVSCLGIGFPLDGLGTSADAYRAVSASVLSLYGSFHAYHMRVIIPASEDKSVMTAAYAACVDNEIKNICFAATVAPDNLDYTDSPAYEYEGMDAPADETEAETEPIGETNPYASTAEDYHEDESDDEAYDADEPDEGDADEGRRNWY